ncbi:MAG: ribonuclease III [Thermoguttaceae bacterium]|nr:ribonuclease III [Thermoguttaceae bacterium]MBQ6620325.1 ribonuclease III [Thermoguttaceae bacterium]
MGEQRSFDRCQKKLGYTFRDIKLLRLALTHKSAALTPVHSNERLEFLGDSFLGLVVTDLLYRRFPHFLEGSLSKIRGEVVSRRSCTRVARALEMENEIILGGGMKQPGDTLLANLTEALIAAIYLDGGPQAAWLFVRRNFEPLIDEASGEIDHSNFKALLAAELHSRQPRCFPQYVLLDEQGPSHLRCFKVQVQISGRVFHAAWANSKKEAEQKAAENALCELKGQPIPWTSG